MAVKFTEDKNIGFVTFDQEDSKANILSGVVLKELDALLDQIKGKALKALVFQSAKPDIFIAGADIKEIETIADAKDGQKKAQVGQFVFNKIEDLPMPTIAVINGAALGGGCELVLACDYRLATTSDRVKIGLPEVNLGFVPGFGGTYRLPRLVGLADALTLILTGKPVDGKKALRLGLVDRLVMQVGIMHHIHQFIGDLGTGKLKAPKYKRKKLKGVAKFLNNSAIGQGIIFDQSRKNVLKLTKGFYPAPLRAIDVVRKNLHVNRERGLEFESKTFGELAITSISKNLIHVFYLSEQFKKLKAPDTDGIQPRIIKKCGVLGAGIMGGGIAQLTSSRGIWTRLKDINHDAIAKGLSAANSVYKSAVKRRRLTKSEAAQGMGHITGALDYSGFQTADIVIEAVVEKMEVKQQVFKELSQVVPERAILASNTSALSVTEMAKVSKHPEQVVGFHFFNPVHRMPLVEVIITEQTSKETIVTTLNLVKQLGKTPILVKDSCGFIVNRILLGYINEGGRLLEETGQMEAIDKIVTDFGMPMGPFLLSDEVGLDVGIKVMQILEHAFGNRFTPVSTFKKILDEGFLGKKNGKGYYLHQQKKSQANPRVKALLGQASGHLNPQAAIERMVLTMVNEAARCLEEHVVDDPGSIDIGMIFGTGFPPFRGGLLKYADGLGIEHVVSRLNVLKESCGERFAPCDYIKHLKNNRLGFYH